MSVPDLDPSRPLLIMANKQDLPGAMNSDEVSYFSVTGNGAGSPNLILTNY